jgi:hypothetical protein
VTGSRNAMVSMLAIFIATVSTGTRSWRPGNAVRQQYGLHDRRHPIVLQVNNLFFFVDLALWRTSVHALKCLEIKA